MAEESQYVTLVEVKKMLEREQEERGEDLTFEQDLALTHSQKYAKLDTKLAENMIHELVQLEKVPDYIAFKMADILPSHPDDVRALFAKERFTLDDSDIKEILSVMKKYL